MNNIRKIEIPMWARKACVVAIIFLVSSTIYVAINDFNAGKTGVILATKIDSMIPFNPRWVWPYYYYYVLLILPIFLVKNRVELRKGMFAFIISGFITSAFFIGWCTQMIRPEVMGYTLAEKLVRGIYLRDQPYNCFPSQHVAYSFTAALVTLRNNKWMGIFALILALTVAASTVLIKQHWFLDLPSGILVAGLSYFLVYKFGWFDFNKGSQLS